MSNHDGGELQPAQTLKRQKILQATLKLLAQRGFHGFSIKQVAEQASVAAGTVYLYFKDRQDLIEQLHLEILQDVAAATFEGWDEQASAKDRYCIYCQRLWDYCVVYPESILCKSQFDQLPLDVLRNQRTLAKKQFAPLNALFEQGRQSGELLNLPDEALVSLSIETILDLARKHVLNLVVVDSDLVAQVIEATWRGISTQ